MKCFTAQQSPYCAASELGKTDCGPEDHPREPHSRPKQRAQTRCSLAAAVRLRVAREEMPGAEVVHIFGAMMWLDGGATTAPASSRNRLLERRDSVWQGRNKARRKGHEHFLFDLFAVLRGCSPSPK